MVYDCAIVGTGIAGLSAGLTLKANGKSVLWLGKESMSEKIEKAELIRNYPGLPMVSGKRMAEIFRAQAEDMGLTVTSETATGIYPVKRGFSILCGEKAFESKTIILSTGVEAVKPISGEKEFLGRGVSYCATCDGFLYKGKRIAVVCTTKALEHEVTYLANLAEKVYLFALYKDVTITAENVEIVRRMPTAITGEKKVSSIVYGENTLPVDGVFFLKDVVSPAVLLDGLDVEEGHVVVDRNMKTNLKGVFAAGDCTGRPYQYAKAAGEGNVSAHAVVEYLAQLEK